MSHLINFESINEAALRNGRALVQELIPGGKFRSLEYIVRNPARDDKNPGSFKINYRSGQWADFATGAKGGDVISWYAHARCLDQAEAARQIAERLGVSLYKANGTNDVGAKSNRGNLVVSRPTATQAPLTVNETAELGTNVALWGEDGPPRQHTEIRRHFYPSDGAPKVKVKIKRKSEPRDTWVTWYRVFRDGAPIGWRDKKPDDYRAIPYVTAALNPFDPELKDDKIYWTEGEKDTDACNRNNLPAFTFGGVGDGLPDGVEHYLKDRHLVIPAHNDDPGRKHAEEKARRAHDACAASIRIIHFLELQHKGDVADFFERWGTVEQLVRRIEEALPWSPSSPIAPDTPSAQDWRAKLVKASDLQTMTFPPARYILPGYIPDGVTIVAGKPKIGKSWLTLDLCLAATGDRFTLGELKPVQGDVLYLALEDNNRRLKNRMAKLLPSVAARWPERLHLVTEWKRANEGGLEDIAAWCRSAANPVMVTIDTLEKFRPPADNRRTAYASDYEAVAGLQKLASEYCIAIVINHHDRKMDADDPFDTVSGTLGLTGAADTIIVLKRRAGTVTLYARGRDIEEKETALQFDKRTCRWNILGTAAEVYISSERAAIISALTNAGKEGLSTSEIIAATGAKSRGAMDTLLFKMKEGGEIIRVGRGIYGLPQDRGKIGQKERIGDQGSANIALNGNLSNLSDLTGSLLGDSPDDIGAM